MKPLPLVALVGNPNAGKTSLFNALTGARQKVGNYPGVTVERKQGRWQLEDGRHIDLIDLPGTYSLDARSPDEQVTHDVVMGRQAGERRPDAIVAVVDATNLDNHRSEEHTSELQSLMRNSYAGCCLKKKINTERQPIK